MGIPIRAVGFVILGATLGSGALAQEQEAPLIIPVDVMTCSYRDGKGPSDLDAAVDAWNAWVDASGRPEVYSAWTLTKHYTGPEQDFDVAWLGAWKNAREMGAGMDNYLANAGEIQAGFAEVVACDTTSNFASLNMRPTPNNDTPSNGVLTMSDCNLEEGARTEDLNAAMAAWSAVLDEHQLEAGIFHWYPVFGGGQEFDFKWVEAFGSHTAFGAYYEAMANGGLYRKSTELFDRVVSCDVARAYNVQNRRFTQLRK